MFLFFPYIANSFHWKNGGKVHGVTMNQSFWGPHIFIPFSTQGMCCFMAYIASLQRPQSLHNHQCSKNNNNIEQIQTKPTSST